MSEMHSANRRQFLAGLGGAAGAAGVTGSALAASATGLDAVAAVEGATIVLVDPRLPMPAAVAERLRQNGARVIELDDDPVRMWRSDIGQVLAHPETRLFGYTRWADYLIVRGLAAESRRHVRHEQFHESQGHFTWLIA
ncbi:MAG: hypothetical protein RLZZ200_265 [Pseudomonadota bacterium]|jgi:hypothetical protein